MQLPQSTGAPSFGGDYLPVGRELVGLTGAVTGAQRRLLPNPARKKKDQKPPGIGGFFITSGCAPRLAIATCQRDALTQQSLEPAWARLTGRE
jgi:hypothetical protein